MTPTKTKLKTNPKIHAIIYSLIFIWVMYMVIKGTPHFWIFAIIIGLVLAYWIWKVMKGANWGESKKPKNIYKVF